MKYLLLIAVAIFIICCNTKSKKPSIIGKPIINKDSLLQVDSFGLTEFNTTRRVLPETEQLQLRAAKGKPIKPTQPPPTTTTSTSGVLFLQFNGGHVQNTSWNYSNPDIVLDSSGLTLAQQQEIYDSAVSKYFQFNIKVTTDQKVYDAAPINKRSECYITQTYQWYSNGAGGVSLVNSFTWGDNTPCFVFSLLLNYNTKEIEEAVPHEFGHTLGLYHAAKYDSACILVSQYDFGCCGKAPIMGVSYSQLYSYFGKFPTPYGCNDIADEIAIIKSKL